jgi:predicted O-linked N-acetylglucosamine transferase (SPINDLY family)
VGRRKEAIAALRTATRLAPQDLEATWHLGVLLQQDEALAEAAEWYERALRIAPGHYEILENYVQVLYGLERGEEAATGLRALLSIRPDRPEHWCQLAGLLEGGARISEAVEAYRQALRHDPGHATAHHGLGNTLCNLGLLDEAIAAYREAQRLEPDLPSIHSNLIMTLHSSPDLSPADILAECRRFAARWKPSPLRDFANARDPDRPLRVGYVSADFRYHPVGSFLARVLPAHDPAQVQAVLYSDTAFPDEQTERLRANAEWRPIVGKTDEEVERMVREDAVDILVDLAGHTGYNRLALFARRVAPVQASWLGYFGTTGLEAMDYIVADEVVLPHGEEALFSEAPVRLPRPYLCWSPTEADAVPGPPPALDNGFVTFGCFNNLRKMNRRLVAVWAEILRRVPGSRLFLKTLSLADPVARAGLLHAFAGHGIAAERLVFEGFSPFAEAMAAYNRIDVALDPFPFGGCTTTADTLWMGVPLVTLDGDRWAGRMSRMILENLGLHDWVAADEAAYVEIAVRLAADPAALAPVRAGLRARLEASPFCDGPDFTRHLEAAYRGMWRTWCDGGRSG